MCRNRRLSFLAASVLCFSGAPALANGSLEYESLEGSRCRVSNGPQPEFTISVGGGVTDSRGERGGNSGGYSPETVSNPYGSYPYDAPWEESYWAGDRSNTTNVQGTVGLRIPLGGDRTRQARLNCERLGQQDQQRLKFNWLAEQVEAGRIKRSSLERYAAELGIELTDEGQSEQDLLGGFSAEVK